MILYKAECGVEGKWWCAMIEKVEYCEDGFGEGKPAVQLLLDLVSFYCFRGCQEFYCYVSIKIDPRIYDGSKLHNIIVAVPGISLNLENDPNPRFVPEMIKKQHVYVKFGSTKSGYLFIDEMIPFSRMGKYFDHYWSDEMFVGKKKLNCIGENVGIEYVPCKECPLANFTNIIGENGRTILNMKASKERFVSGWYCGSISNVFVNEKLMGSYLPTIRLDIGLRVPWNDGLNVNQVSYVWSPVKDHELEIRSILDKIHSQKVENMEILTLANCFKSHERDSYLIYFDYDDKGCLIVKDMVHLKRLERMRKYILKHFDGNLLRMGCEECDKSDECLMARSRNIKIKCRDTVNE